MPSLVGSEMCIRDKSRTIHLCSRPKPCRVRRAYSRYRKDAGLRTLCGRLFKCFFLRFLSHRGAGTPTRAGTADTVRYSNQIIWNPLCFRTPVRRLRRRSGRAVKCCLWCSVEQFVAAWRYDVAFRGGAWSVEKVFGLVGVQYWHAQRFRLTAFLGQMM